ncbi:MAG: phosphate propanoyltransferase [Oscillospiraceae bacterium]|nr:phosphate propanoyltransferase [Oscillospiraceae bacterium]
MGKFLVETSARHGHLSQKDVETLFGEGYRLTLKKELSQPGQFVCNEKVTVKFPKGQYNMSIIGPERPFSQFEISATDARSMGITAYTRESGDITETAGCTIVGPKGEVTLDEGVIVSKRHIHLPPAAADELDVKDKQIVWVRLDTDKSVIYGDVVVRVNESFSPAMHIDTDEANAAGAAGELYGEIVSI